MQGTRSQQRSVGAGKKVGSSPRIYSFPPVVDANARVLILGSMPGKASLAANKYYAHRQNRFWTIMGELVGAGPGVPYDERLNALRAHGIALWDVLHSCTRNSSLDSDIDNSSIRPNAVVKLLRSHPTITRVYFNGQKAEHTFEKHLRKDADRIGRVISYVRLPSTSPANASIPYADKLRRWRAVVDEE